MQRRSDSSAASRRENCSSIAATIRRCSFSGGRGIGIADSAPFVNLRRVVPFTYGP